MPRHLRTGIIRGADPVAIDRGRDGACLLLHGWITSPADFGLLVPALDAAGWDVFAPLHPGHGTTPLDLLGITADKLLDAAREEYRALRGRYGRVVLVGFSMGGTIASILAAEEPPDRLVLVAPFCGVRYRLRYVLPPRWWSALLSPLLRTVPRPRRMVGVNRSGGRRDIIIYDSFPTDATRALFALRRRLVRRTDLGRIRSPALLVYSTGDATCSRRATEATFARMGAAPKSRAIFQRSNHHILHDHDREQAVAAIAEFVGSP